MKKVTSSKQGDSVGERAILACFVELSYLLLARVILPQLFEGTHLELALGGVRALCAAIYARLLYRDLARERLNVTSPRTLLVAVTLILAGALCTANVDAPNSAYRVVFVLGSIFVGLREELFYRAFLQRALSQRMAIGAAIFVSNVFFVLYHVGAQPLDSLSVMEIFIVGCVLGAVYVATGSIIPSIVCHIAYDMFYAWSPLIEHPYPREMGLFFQLLSLAFAASSLRSVALRSASVKQT